MSDSRKSILDRIGIVPAITIIAIASTLCVLVTLLIGLQAVMYLQRTVLDDPGARLNATGGTQGISEGELYGDGWGGTSGRAPDADR